MFSTVKALHTQSTVYETEGGERHITQPIIPYRTALYCRLSKDDEQIGESTSIETQRLMLSRFCQENQLAIVDYYVDDGFSGLSYDRPDFQRMVEDIESGLIDLVITKDLSRLGRDYIMTGYLTDIYFNRMGVRYIAINDGIDTQRDSNDIAPFKNIMNDMYAKDISRKIKSAKRQRAYQGMFISAQTPYGYLVDPNDHSHLVVDEAVADNVRLIFQLALEGNTLSQMASILHDRGIPIPGVHKAKMGESRFARHLMRSEDEQITWNTCTLAKLLHDPVYLGHMVNHKYEVISYKTKELRRVPKEEHIIVENTHEPIIDADTFEKVQDILAGRSHVHRHEFDNWLQGKVYCADCQKPMTLQIKVYKESKRPIFRCIHSYKYPKECNGYRAMDYDRVLRLAYDKILAECPYLEETPELTKTLVRQRVDRVLIGKRQKDGNQDVQVLLNDPKKRKRRFALSLFGEL